MKFPPSAVVAAAVFVAACRTGKFAEVPQIPGPAKKVSRDQTIEIAEAYASMEWTPDYRHSHHGHDSHAVTVHTPDRHFRRAGIKTGYWEAGEVQKGMPYKWGGFSSLADFDAGVEAGMLAGQLTDGKKLDASRHAVRVDCSGFVARAWNLPFKQSTRSLGRLCYELGSYDELHPGDLINKFDAHAMLFVAFEGDDRSRVRNEASRRFQDSVHRPERDRGRDRKG